MGRTVSPTALETMFVMSRPRPSSTQRPSSLIVLFIVDKNSRTVCCDHSPTNGAQHDPKRSSPGGKTGIRQSRFLRKHEGKESEMHRPPRRFLSVLMPCLELRWGGEMSESYTILLRVSLSSIKGCKMSD